MKGYSKVTLPALEQELLNQRAEFDKSGQSALLSAKRNFIVLAARKAYLGNIEKLLEIFVNVYPGRFFVIYVDNSLPELKVSVTSKCHALGQDQHICSDVIQVALPSDALRALSSIVRAHMLPGVAAELFVYGSSQLDIEALQVLSRLADRLVVDSGPGGLELVLVSRLGHCGAELVDLDWIRLAPWRQEIARLFAREPLVHAQSDITALTIDIADSDVPGVANSGLLLAGWIVTTLKWEVVSFWDQRYECRSSNGSEVLLSLRRANPVARKVGLRSARIDFSASAPHGLKHMEICKNDVLSSTIEFEGKLGSSRPLFDESITGCLMRYFLVGESTKDYHNALETALELESLSRGYLVTS